jgi:hypothetical protein
MTVRVTREAEPQIELYGAYSGELVGGGKRTLTFTPTGTYLTMVVKNSLSKVQVEQGGFKTSYIPTTGASATRAADIASIPVSAFGYNQKAGSVVVETDLFNTTGSATTFDLNDDTTSNRILVNSRMQNSSGSSAAVISSGSNVTTSFSSLSGAKESKVALTYSDNDFATSANGSEVTVDTSGAVPQGITLADIGNNPSNQSVSGHIKSIKYYPRRLTNAQLQELTT